VVTDVLKVWAELQVVSTASEAIIHRTLGQEHFNHMRAGFLFAFAVCAAVVLTGCGLFGSDNNKSSDVFNGDITVGLTDNVPTGSPYVIQNIYNPNVRQIIAVVSIANAKPGMTVEGQWYQMHVFEAGNQNRDTTLPPTGTLVTKAGFEISQDSINSSTQRGGGRLTFSPTSPLPEDSYKLLVYVDGKLAKEQPFVVSRLVPGPSGTGGGGTSNTGGTQQTAPTPVRTATPAR
jgi:hypothetical protein